jgi:integrase
LLINANIPTKIISEQLGHANTAITQDLYAHVYASSKAKAMKALEMTLLNRSVSEVDTAR